MPRAAPRGPVLPAAISVVRPPPQPMSRTFPPGSTCAATINGSATAARLGSSSFHDVMRAGALHIWRWASFSDISRASCAADYVKSAGIVAQAFTQRFRLGVPSLFVKEYVGCSPGRQLPSMLDIDDDTASIPPPANAAPFALFSRAARGCDRAPRPHARR